MQASTASSSQAAGNGTANSTATTASSPVKAASTVTTGPLDFARSQLFAAHSDDADSLDLEDDQPMLAAASSPGGTGSDRKTTLTYVG